MRIALATVGTTGDVAPFAILAQRLVERGHEVTAISWPVHGAALSQPGVRVEVAGPHADATRIATVAAEAASRGPMDQVAVLRDFHLADGEEHLRRLRTLLPGHDLVVLHAIHSLAQAAVLDTGVRYATAVFDPVLMPTAAAPPPGMPGLGPANRLAWWFLDRALARTNRPLDELLVRSGSAHRSIPLFRARSPLLHLVACSPSIIEVRSDWPSSTLVTGAWIDPSPRPSLPAQLESFLDDGPAPVTISFGSMAGASDAVLDEAVRGILDGGRRVVVQGSVAASVSSDNLLRTGAVDHRALFPRSSLVVHHGGAGTTHAACAAGIPSLVVPHVGDQRYWADRLHRLGVAPAAVPVGNLRSDLLADAVLAAAGDPLMRRRAGELAAAIGKEEGLTAAVRAIEALTH